jgi:hypothetical protein
MPGFMPLYSFDEGVMRYDEFRNQLQKAFQALGLFGQRAGNPAETVNLETMSRHWQIYLVGAPSTDIEPFSVTAKIAFDWNPFASARSYTCEEDLLSDLLGRTKNALKTKPQYIRVDLELFARLPYGSTSTIPDARTFGSWAESVKQKLKVLNESKWRKEKLVAILGWLGEVQIESKCDSAGCLSFQAVSISGFLMVRVPRMWNDSERQDAEKGAEAELSLLAQKFKHSMQEWNASVVELVRWIRYTPPPSDIKRIEPQFNDLEDEDVENDPETIH